MRGKDSRAKAASASSRIGSSKASRTDWGSGPVPGRRRVTAQASRAFWKECRSFFSTREPAPASQSYTGRTSAIASLLRRSVATESGTIRSCGATTSLVAMEPVSTEWIRKESGGEKENVVATTYAAAQKKGRSPTIGGMPSSLGEPRRFQKEVVGRREGASVGIEKDETDSLDAREQLARLAQPGGLSLRQIHLRDVARDDGPRSESNACQEHPHLLRGRVLGLIQDDERVVQGAPPHEGDRGNLDDAALEQLRGLLVPKDVVERVVERTQVRVDLLHHVARQKSQALPRFHRRPSEHDSLDLLFQKIRRRHGHRQVRLPRSRRADREDEVVAVDGLHVEALLDVAR